ncbi:MAG: hypothetical protein ABI333_09740 [bacterium]
MTRSRTASLLLMTLTTVGTLAACGPTNDGTTPENDSWTVVAPGGNHTCGLQTDGRLWCWGANSEGQLGDGTLVGGSNPRPVGLVLEAVQVTAGAHHSCTVLMDGSVWCWGANRRGQLGNGSTSASAQPVEVALPAGAAMVSAGYAHTCAVLVDGSAWCWGANGSGQLGIGNAVGPEECGPLPEDVCGTTPQAVEELADLSVISAGGSAEGSHTCARLEDRSTWCWGDNSERQLGDSTLISHNAPVELTDLINVTSLAAGERHSCARLGDGSAFCWGRSFGDPFWISTLDSVDSVCAGGDFSCGVAGDRTAWCWGSNGEGQLGDGTNLDRVVPVQVVGLLVVARLAAGGRHACAVTDAGQLWCWGSNSDGQVGGTSLLSTNLPTRVMN